MQVISVFIEHSIFALSKTFDYLASSSLNIKPLSRVLVRFGKQEKTVGFVMSVSSTNLSKEELDNQTGINHSYIIELIDKEPLIDENLLELAKKASTYYLCPLISILKAMLPSSLKPSYYALKGPKIAYDKYVYIAKDDETELTPKQIEAFRLVKENGEVLKKEAGSVSIVNALIGKGIFATKLKEKNRLKLDEIKSTLPPILNYEQKEAMEGIYNSTKPINLLQGVTGSGKTEVYLQLSSLYLKEGKGVIMLVPEISLTPRMVNFFKSRFGDGVAILHSGLTNGEKYDEYRRIKNGEANIVVGARSAIFAPIKNLGLIILDEEHVSSYKQDTPPYYSARTIALIRARLENAKVVLGSATPNIETKAKAEKGTYGYFELKKRYNELPLPKVSIIDLSKRGALVPNAPIFSKDLLEKIKQRVANKEQIMLLINKRGYSSYLTCASCGHVFTCPNCNCNLTYHKTDSMLKCHHCGFVLPYPETCPVCNSPKIRRVGFGTERVEKVLKENIPEIRIARLDTDITKIRNNLSKTLESFKQGEFDCLVGTQMIAKGHDFPNVTLVGVMLADIGLSLPSYTSSEDCFNLIAQVCGRAGRGEKVGEAVIQTYNPTNYAINLGCKQDYYSFYRKEMEARRIGKYPPYCHLICLIFSSKDEEKLNASVRQVKQAIDDKKFDSVVTIGPLTPFINKNGDIYKKELLIKFSKSDEIKKYIYDLLLLLSGKGGVKISSDVDPISY